MEVAAAAETPKAMINQNASMFEGLKESDTQIQHLEPAIELQDLQT